MRKLSVFNMISLDGYFDGTKPWDLGWHHVEGEFNRFAIEQLDGLDMILFGRMTYEGMAAYWQSAEALKNDRQVAERMNKTPKVVFSRTLTNADWQNTRLIKENVSEEVTKLKQAKGKELVIFGSSNLTVSLMELGLIDEFRIMVNPVVLGKGRALFAGLKEPRELRLIKNRVFNNGNVLLYYQPAQ